MAPMAATISEEQHRVGLGEPRFHAQHGRAQHHQRRERRPPAADKGKRAPVGRQHRAHCAGERRHAVKPDARAGAGNADGFRGLHHRRLQPVDADRFLVTHLILETDVDVVARLDHLFGGLREARLVAVDGRDLENSGHEGDHGNDREHGERPPV